jgi:hypothetical protein
MWRPKEAQQNLEAAIGDANTRQNAEPPAAADEGEALQESADVPRNREPVEVAADGDDMIAVALKMRPRNPGSRRCLLKAVRQWAMICSGI